MRQSVTCIHFSLSGKAVSFDPVKSIGLADIDEAYTRPNFQYDSLHISGNDFRS